LQERIVIKATNKKLCVWGVELIREAMYETEVSIN